MLVFLFFSRIRIEFKHLEKTLLTVPPTAKEMVQLVEFVQNLKGTDFDILLEKVEVINFIFSKLFKKMWYFLKVVILILIFNNIYTCICESYPFL